MTHIPLFLRDLIDQKKPVFVYLLNGIKLQGTLIDLEHSFVLLERDGKRQLVARAAISTIAPQS